MNLISGQSFPLSLPAAAAATQSMKGFMWDFHRRIMSEMHSLLRCKRIGAHITRLITPKVRLKASIELCRCDAINANTSQLFMVIHSFGIDKQRKQKNVNSHNIMHN